MNGHFKTISWVKLWYWLIEICLSGDLNSRCAKASPVSLTNSHFNTTFQIKQMHPWRPEQWMYSVFPCVTDEWPFQDHLLSETLLTQRALFSEKPGQCPSNLFPSVHFVACHSETSECNSTNSNSSVLADLKSNYAKSLLQTVSQPYSLPFHDSLPSITLPNERTCPRASINLLMLALCPH